VGKYALRNKSWVLSAPSKDWKRRAASPYLKKERMTKRKKAEVLEK